MSSTITSPLLESVLRWLSLSIQELSSVPQSKPHRSQESFGQRLARLRKLQGYTQRALATESGVSQRMIAYYETHAATPPGDALAAIARALDVPMDELLGLKASATEAPASTASLRLWRQFREVESLPEADRKTVLHLVDALVEKQRLLQKQSLQQKKSA